MRIKDGKNIFLELYATEHSFFFLLIATEQCFVLVFLGFLPA